MSSRDSGIIDLFAIHKEEEQRVIDATPSAPPPAMAMDIDTSDVDPELFAASQQKARTRTKILGGAIGAVAVLGILIAAITTSGTKEAPAAAAAPPPVATVVAAPPPAEPVPTPAPPPTASGKPDYTPATAAAAYAAAQPKKKGGGKAKIGANVKMQKVQSGGVN